MAKQAEETVTVPASLLQQLQDRLASLEGAQRAQTLRADGLNVLDEAWEKKKQEISRPAPVKTQERSDREYGTAAPRFRVRLDSSGPDGKPGPNVSEAFPLDVSAASDLEAQARYQQLMGITKHDYRVVAEPLAA